VANTLVFYDGVCGLCDGFVQFLLKRDPAGRFRFAPLQGALAQRLLPQHSIDPAELSSVVLIKDWKAPTAQVFTRSRAVLEAAAILGGPWRWTSAVGRIVPRPVADMLYGLVARYRYRVFGKFEICPLPRPEWRGRFLE
jgi:predicted DCC family thiol-disulfide oxidoreductase YuxK